MIEILGFTLSYFELGLVSLPLVILLALLRIPIGVAMFLVGITGNYFVMGNMFMIDNQLKTFAFGDFANYSLSIIPLFLLMSEFAILGGMSTALFKAADAWLGHLRGGVAIATIGACAGFGAICGSSVATASSMGRVAFPELKKSGYSAALSTGCLAAGGTLGILIPPSVILVIYGILAEENIEKLFTASLIPGLIAMSLYMIAIAIYTRIFHEVQQVKPKASYKERFKKMRESSAVIIIFLVVIGGIYAGVFSPTAAAGVGAMATGIVAWVGKKITWNNLQVALLNTGKTSAMIFFIILAASVYNSFLSSARVPQTLATVLLAFEYSPWVILLGILLLFLILGTVMDSMAIIFLTVPIFVPIVTQLDFGIPTEEVGIWFGVLVLMLTEMGLITPPIGMNLFVINALSPDVKIADTYRGVMPFIISDFIRIALLVAFPTLTMFLVRLLY